MRQRVLKAVRPFVVLISLGGFLGCSPAPHQQKHRWSSQTSDAASRPSLVDPTVAQMAAEAEVISLGEQEILRGKMVVAGAAVEESWFQALRTRDGKFQYESAGVVSGLDASLGERVARLRAEEHEILATTRKSFPSLRTAYWQADPEVVVLKEFDHYAPFLRVRYLSRGELQAREMLINERGRVRGDAPVGAGAVNGLATVFPTNPKESLLTEQILHDLVGDGTLAGRLVRTLSALPDAPYNPRNEFRYTPADSAFDVVQAYYFADQQVRWFEETLGLKLSKTLEVKLHVGAPQKSTAMFYFNGQIRLGDGDDVTWRGIPRDPSIVKHEVGHAFVEMLASLPSRGEGGSYNEAFADIFFALATQTPRLGEYAYLKGPFTRSIANDRRAYKDFNAGVYNDSLVVSGTFWDIQSAVGAEKAAKLAKAFLLRLGPGGQLKDFVPVIGDAARSVLSPEDQTSVMAAVQARGWIN